MWTLFFFSFVLFVLFLFVQDISEHRSIRNEDFDWKLYVFLFISLSPFVFFVILYFLEFTTYPLSYFRVSLYLLFMWTPSTVCSLETRNESPRTANSVWKMRIVFFLFCNLARTDFYVWDSEHWIEHFLRTRIEHNHQQSMAQLIPLCREKRLKGEKYWTTKSIVLPNLN